MNLIYSSKKIGITEAMKEYMERKSKKIEKFFSVQPELTVTFDIQKLNHSVELLLNDGKNITVSKAITKCMYESMDEAMDKLISQLKKKNTRIRYVSVKKHNSKKTICNKQTYEEENKVMTYEEAKCQMKLLNIDNFVFKDIDGFTVNIIK